MKAALRICRVTAENTEERRRYTRGSWKELWQRWKERTEREDSYLKNIKGKEVWLVKEDTMPTAIMRIAVSA